jgi:non-ribosomal peptide synthetase component F
VTRRPGPTTSARRVRRGGPGTNRRHDHQTSIDHVPSAAPPEDVISLRCSASQALGSSAVATDFHPRRPYLLSHLVERAAERDSTGLAVVGGDERLDHATLADRVSRLAGALRSQGVTPGDRVVVFAPKSTETFVAMHAILRAGGIAVPGRPALASVRARGTRSRTGTACDRRRRPNSRPVARSVGSDRRRFTGM